MPPRVETPVWYAKCVSTHCQTGDRGDSYGYPRAGALGDRKGAPRRVAEVFPQNSSTGGRAACPQHEVDLGRKWLLQIISCVLRLEARDGVQTRLIVRLRARFRAAPRSLLFAAAFDLGDFIMMRKPLIGIRQRAEWDFRAELAAAEAL